MEGIIQVLLDGGVTLEQFENFIVTYGIQNDPYIQGVLRRLIIEREVNKSPCLPAYEWDVEDADQILDALQSPNSPDQFEPWSPATLKAVMREEEIQSATLACLNDGDFT